MEKWLRNILAMLVMGLLFLPMAQLTMGLWDESKLEGIDKNAKAPTWRWHDWREGTFQDTLSAYADAHVGFMNTLIRLNNQYYYSVLNTAIANHVIIGKHGYLYDRAHIAAYTGADYLGNDTLQARMGRIRELQDILGRKGIKLFIVFVPGKAMGTPEFLPEGTGGEGAITNYKRYKQLADSMGVPALDLIAWYKAQRPISPYPLYPPGGIHWSQYCATIAFDTVLGFMRERIVHEPLRRMIFKETKWSWKPLGADHDIGRGMNLLFPTTGIPMAYTTVGWDTLPPKYDVLTVGDSYYFKAFTDFTGAPFKRSALWFYHRELHTYGDMTIRYNDQLDIIREIENRDVIILYTADANLKEFSWGFVDEALKAYKDPVRRGADLKLITERIQSDHEWMAKIEAAAVDSGLPVDTMLLRNARYVLEAGRLR